MHKRRPQALGPCPSLHRPPPCAGPQKGDSSRLTCTGPVLLIPSPGSVWFVTKAAPRPQRDPKPPPCPCSPQGIVPRAPGWASSLPKRSRNAAHCLSQPISTCPHPGRLTRTEPGLLCGPCFAKAQVNARAVSPQGCPGFPSLLLPGRGGQA